MPLSPLLSSFYLREFDKKLIRRKIQVVRYADDLIAFCDSEREASTILESIAEGLSNLDLAIPALSEAGSKSAVYGPGENVEFLGIDLRLTDGKIKKYVPQVIFDRVAQRVAKHEDWNEAQRAGMDFVDTTRILGGIEASYASAYRKTENYDSFRSHVKKQVADVRRTIIYDTFPAEIIDRMGKKQRQYWGIDPKTRRSKRVRRHKRRFEDKSNPREPGTHHQQSI